MPAEQGIMGVSATHGLVSSETNGHPISTTNSYSIDLGVNHGKFESKETDGRESPFMGSTMLNESPQFEARPHNAFSIKNSLSTARALGSMPQRDGDIFDMICIGFGPASLAIAIALADAYSKSSRPLPKVLFLEKQEEFAWHSGMQLPSAKMQISFLKDLATPRDPTSPYTFINYLHSKGRLHQFINLGTFLPSRLEYEDYMRWCAEHFKGVVKYGRQVISVRPGAKDPVTQKTRNFQVNWKYMNCVESGLASARHVVVAVGGEPHIPEEFKPFMALPRQRVEHSSQYARSARVLENIYRRPTFLKREREAKEGELATVKATVEEEKLLYQRQISEVEPTALPWTKKRHSQFHEHEKRVSDLEQEVIEAQAQEEICNAYLREAGFKGGRLRFVVIGGGQSAAEIFCDLWDRFPDADVCMIITDAALRPSDDSPFVNEIFDPECVDGLYHQSPEDRRLLIDRDKGTNYGVVRLELLEHIYEQMYMQRIQNPDPSHWRCRVITNRKVTNVKVSEDNSSLLLQLTPTHGKGQNEMEELAFSHVFVATGYTRNAHQELLKGTKGLLPRDYEGDGFPVCRDYRINYDRNVIEDGSGVWLQGCNESTHGLSDTLLSILAVRGGEIVSSIFGDDLARGSH